MKPKRALRRPSRRSPPFPACTTQRSARTSPAANTILVFYADLDDKDALTAFRDHPLHVAHRGRCASLVTGRLAGDLEV
ncbi:MAG: hypothetical protein ACLR4Z_14575 [Butyricicoccaceae bacterium]